MEFNTDPSPISFDVSCIKDGENAEDRRSREDQLVDMRGGCNVQVTRRLLTWNELQALQHRVPNFIGRTNDAYVRTEEFYHGHKCMSTINVVMITWGDGRQTTMKLDRLRSYLP